MKDFSQKITDKPCSCNTHYSRQVIYRPTRTLGKNSTNKKRLLRFSHIIKFFHICMFSKCRFLEHYPPKRTNFRGTFFRVGYLFKQDFRKEILNFSYDLLTDISFLSANNQKHDTKLISTLKWKSKEKFGNGN